MKADRSVFPSGGMKEPRDSVPGSAVEPTDDAAEGIEALKEVSGSVDDVLNTLIGGVQSGMGYLGAKTLPEFRAKARYVRVTPAGQTEAAPHDAIEVATRKG